MKLVKVPIEDILDLHTFNPKEIPDLLSDFLSFSCYLNSLACNKCNNNCVIHFIIIIKMILLNRLTI